MTFNEGKCILEADDSFHQQEWVHANSQTLTLLDPMLACDLPHTPITVLYRVFLHNRFKFKSQLKCKGRPNACEGRTIEKWKCENDINLLKEK